MQFLKSVFEVKSAVDSGLDVRCDGGGYRVFRDKKGQYLINFIGSDYYIGLHGLNGTEYSDTMNGKDFYIKQ